MYVTKNAEIKIWQRWDNIALRMEMEKFIGFVPKAFRDQPRAMLARQVASPNHENFRFSELALSTGLKPLWWTYSGDVFCTASKEKIHWGKMVFYRGKDKNGDPMRANISVIDFHASDKKPFTEIMTNWGEGFIDFHKRIFTSSFPNSEIWDATPWYLERGQEPKKYYLYYLALFVCHGILFENFLETGKEQPLTENIVKPAIAEIEKRFGLRPLIVPLLPLKEENNLYWMWYPQYFESEVRTCTQIAIKV